MTGDRGPKDPGVGPARTSTVGVTTTREERVEMDEKRRVEDFRGVAIGTVDDDGWVTDFAGVRFGVRTTKDDVIDFSGVRLGASVQK